NLQPAAGRVAEIPYKSGKRVAYLSCSLLAIMSNAESACLEAYSLNNCLAYLDAVGISSGFTAPELLIFVAIIWSNRGYVSISSLITIYYEMSLFGFSIFFQAAP